jgi:hypothetical protein
MAANLFWKGTKVQDKKRNSPKANDGTVKNFTQY